MTTEHGEIAPNWEHWLNMSEVTAKEFVLLSLNVEPKIFPNHSSAKRFDSKSKSQIDEVKQRLGPYQPRLEELISALRSQSSKSNFGNAIYRIPPGDESLVALPLANCLTWLAALPCPWTVPERLASFTKETARIPHAPEPKADSHDPRLIASFERILLSLALSKFGFDPDKRKNNTAKDIHLETKKYGLEVSEGSIREKLRKASASHVDRKVRDRIRLNREHQNTLFKKTK